MTEPLFRKQALDQLSKRGGLDQALKVTNPVGWLTLVTFSALILFALVWSTLTEVPIQVKGRGILLNPGGVAEVVSSSEGRLLDLLVAPGERIAKGQIIARLDQSDLKLELALKQAELEGQRAHLAAIEAFHKRDHAAREAHNSERSSALEKRIELLSERLKWQKELDDVLEGMWQKKLINREKLLGNKIQINQIRETLADAETERTSLNLEAQVSEIEYEREVLNISEKIAALKLDIESLQERLKRHGAVYSPYAGLMVESKVNAGEFVSVGHSLLTLIRDDTSGEEPHLRAVVYVPPTDGKKIKADMEVAVSLSTIKREEYGFVRGRVVKVSEVPATSKGMLRTLKNDRLVESLSGEEGAPFEVRVKLLTDTDSASGYQWSSGKGPDTRVHGGTLIDADVSVRYVRLITLVFPALEQLFSRPAISSAAKG